MTRPGKSERIALLAGMSIIGMFGGGVAFAVRSAGTTDSQLEALLRSKDQALLDAVAPGDRSLWDRELAPDAIYADENGEVFSRSQFLSELAPLPSFVSGTIKIVDYQLHRSGDVAMVVHKDEEHELFYGIPLRADYLMTETWVRSEGGWKLAMVHAHVMAKDPPAVTLPGEILDQYIGRYRLADSVIYAVRRDGDHLVAGTEGKSARPLLPEATDVFFTPGRPRSRKIFRHSGGKVSEMIDRREGEDLVYSRIP